MSSSFRIIPLFRHGFNSLHPLSTYLQTLRSPILSHPVYASSRHRHVPKHHSHESLSRYIDHYILPNRPYPPHSCGRPFEFSVLPQKSPPKGRHILDSHVYWCRNHLILRAETGSFIQSRNHWLSERYPCIDKCHGVCRLHGVGSIISKKA